MLVYVSATTILSMYVTTIRYSGSTNIHQHVFDVAGVGHAAAPDCKGGAKLSLSWGGGRSEAGDRSRTRWIVRCVLCVSIHAAKWPVVRNRRSRFWR